jgi:hypothetical protein
MLMNTRMRWQASDGRLPLGKPRQLAERTFLHGDVPAVRRFAEAFGARTGIGPARLADFVLAVSEAAACAATWGPCAARVRLWVSGSRAFCEVRGNATVLRRVAHGTAWQGVAWQGAAQPDVPRGEAEALRHRVLRHVCDYVSVASGPGGPWVLLSMRVRVADSC